MDQIQPRITNLTTPEADLNQQLKVNMQLNNKNDQNENTFTHFNKTLNYLQDQTLKRYNTDFKQKQTQSPSKIDLKINYKSQYYPQAEKFIPEPWNSERQSYILNNKFNCTDIYLKNKRPYLSKSFHSTLPKGRNDKNSQRKQYLRSNSSADNYTKHEKSHFLTAWPDKLNINDSNYSDHYNVMSQNFSYTNQQKARVSLDYLVHQKKQKKMSKILKMKTHCFDKTLFKQQKIHHQSKFLIEALQKLSSDNILKKSIDRAVEVLKKRTNSPLKNQTKKKVSNSLIEQSPVNWLSCKKLSTVYEPQGQSNKQKQFNSDHKFQSSFLKLKPQRAIAEKQKCKVSFRPKRNWIIEGHKTKPDVDSNNKNKSTKNLSKVDQKCKNFLKIQHLDV